MKDWVDLKVFGELKLVVIDFGIGFDNHERSNEEW
jgi:hypothetical protein